MEPRYKFKHLSKFPLRERIQLSETSIRWLIASSYIKESFWFEYLVNYYNLFEDQQDAITKAKTYSLSKMCWWLHYEKDCSYTRIYGLLMKEIAAQSLSISVEILNIESKLLFINSLEELQ